MKAAVRAVLLLIFVFAITAFVMALLLDLNADQVRGWLIKSKERPSLVFVAVVLVLAVDSVLAVPTITTVVFAGYLLGPLLGGLSSIIGILLAGSFCYWGGRFAGLSRWVKPETAEDVRRSVGQVGPLPLLLARASPMLPEVLSAMAGAGSMPASRYYLYFLLGNLPFSFAVAYAGSVSTLERPWPALVVGVGIPASMMLVFLVRRRSRKSASAMARQGSRTE